MASRFEHFPSEITALPDFEGPFDAYRLAATGCDVLFASYPAGTSIAPHSHPTNNVGVITQGELILTVDGDRSTYGPGDWYHVPAGVEHAAEFAVDSAEIEFWFEQGAGAFAAVDEPLRLAGGRRGFGGGRAAAWTRGRTLRRPG